MLPLLCFPHGDSELCPAWAPQDKVWRSRHHLRYACLHAKESFVLVYKNSTSYFDHNTLCFNGYTETLSREIETYRKGTELQSTRPYMVTSCLYPHCLPEIFPLLLSLWHNFMSSTIASLSLPEYSSHVLIIPP